MEQQQQKFRSQASVIDEIVDTAFEVNQAGHRREGERSFSGGSCPEVASYNQLGIFKGWHWFTHPPVPSHRLEKKTSGSDPGEPLASWLPMGWVGTSRCSAAVIGHWRDRVPMEF